MSDQYDPIATALPTGRRLDDVDTGRPKFVISKFPQATPARVEVARKNLPEILDENLDRSTDPWTDRQSGEKFQLIREFFNIVDPGASNAAAFVISDGNLLGLRRADYEEVSTSVPRRQHEESAMTSQEYRRQRREMARRRVLAKELAAAKAVRDEATRRTRVAKEAERFAIQHGLPPQRIYEARPTSTLPASFGGLRPSPRRTWDQARRVDQVLEDFGLR